MALLLGPQLDRVPLVHSGKVRDTYDLGDALLIVASDRISAFDVVMQNGVPDKGRVLTQMSNFWFEKLAHVCPNHLLETDNASIKSRVPGWTPELFGRSVIARKAVPLKIECVARGYITGSLFREYASGGSRLHGIALPHGLRDGDRLPDPIFTPATKAEQGHDENISFHQAADIVGLEAAERVRDWTLSVYCEASKLVAGHGLILADTKLEFGWVGDELVWIDEALTPDSSRFWQAAAWQPGGPQPSYDKQFVRDYLESIGWNKRPPGPELPAPIVEQTRQKYFECFERVTGKHVQTGP